MGSLNYYYSMRLKKGLNSVFLEWLYTTAAMFTPFLIVPASLFLFTFYARLKVSTAAY